MKTVLLDTSLKVYGAQDVLAQQKYYNDAVFSKVTFPSVEADKVTDNVTPKIRKINYSPNMWKNFNEETFHVFTVEEYHAWLASGGK